MKTVVTTRNSFARATRRSTLKLNLKIEDKENNSPGKALKSKRKKSVETKKRQKHIKNAIKQHGQTISQKPDVKKEEITLNTRGKRRRFIEVNDYEEEVEKPEVITQKKYVNFGHLLTYVLFANLSSTLDKACCQNLKSSDHENQRMPKNVPFMLVIQLSELLFLLIFNFFSRNFAREAAVYQIPKPSDFSDWHFRRNSCSRPSFGFPFFELFKQKYWKYEANASIVKQVVSPQLFKLG